MLDRLYTGDDAPLDALRRVDVGADVGAPVTCGLDRGTYLILGILDRVERIVDRRYAAARHDLDLARALHQLLARAAQHLGAAVGDGGRSLTLGEACRVPGHPRQFAQEAEVAVPGSLAQHGTGGEDPRALDHALVDGHLEAECRPTGVAHRREAAHQSGTGLASGHQVDPTDILRQRGDLADADECRMPVCVDEPGNDGPASAIDDLDAIRPLSPGRQAGDAASLDENVDAVLHGERLAVEKPQVREQQWTVGRLSSGAARCEAETGEHGDDC